jgi:putative transposase
MNQEWALDFVHDAVECGRAIRVLSVVDAYTRECLALEVNTSFASRRVTPVWDAIVAERGHPLAIRCDNGPELTSRYFLAWRVERQIEFMHIQPGKPTQNARVESFHGWLRDECDGKLVSELVRCEEENRSVEGRVQRGASA